ARLSTRGARGQPRRPVVPSLPAAASSLGRSRTLACRCARHRSPCPRRERWENMAHIPAALDPLRSRAIFDISDMSKLRSPIPKVTMGGRLLGSAAGGSCASGSSHSRPEVRACNAMQSDPGLQQDFQRLTNSSPLPKVLLQRFDPMALPSASTRRDEHVAVMPPPPPFPTLPAAPPATDIHAAPRQRQSRTERDASGARTDDEGCGRSVQEKTLDVTQGSVMRLDNVDSMGHPGKSYDAKKGAGAKPAHESKGGASFKATERPLGDESPGRGPKQAVQLRSWYLRPSEGGISVEGVRCDAGAGSSFDRSWHSTIIVERVGQRVLKTASGSVYELIGGMNTSAAFSCNVRELLAAAEIVSRAQRQLKKVERGKGGVSSIPSSVRVRATM
ncbi:MAG: hypothetical protein SGPRY_000312, partial [Prymnesium sp.]